MDAALVEKALKAKRESKYVEFKESFDVTSKGEWCEILKDIVALANSGGGAIVFGMKNGGNPSGADVKPILAVDGAVIANKVHQYTGVDFSGFELHDAEKDGAAVAVLVVEPARSPIAFTKPGTYPTPGEKQQQKTAFSQGTVYFRHGAKSEPGTTADIADAIELRVEKLRKSWVAGLRKVVQAPEGARVTVEPMGVRHAAMGMPIKVVDDPSAPAYRLVDPDSEYPHRQKELIREVRRGIPRGIKFNQFDVQAIRKVHGVDSRAEYTYKSKFGSRQYSEPFVEWIIAMCIGDGAFLQETRRQFKISNKRPAH